MAPVQLQQPALHIGAVDTPAQRLALPAQIFQGGGPARLGPGRTARPVEPEEIIVALVEAGELVATAVTLEQGAQQGRLRRAVQPLVHPGQMQGALARFKRRRVIAQGVHSARQLSERLGQWRGIGPLRQFLLTQALAQVLHSLPRRGALLG